MPPSDVPRQPSDSEAMNALDPGIWPATAERDADTGAVRVGGIGVRELVADHGSPLVVMDEMDFRTRASGYRTAFAQAGASQPDSAAGERSSSPDVYYAGKAFLSTIVARWICEEGLGVDVSTGGELAVTLRAGVPGSHIVMHGNNKSADEIRSAVSAGVGTIVIDCFEDIARVGFIAAELGETQAVMVRVTPGVEAHTHEFIATASEDQKFGFSIASGDAMEAVRRVLMLPELRLVGLHCHIGSQIFVVDGFEVAARRVVRFMASVRDELGCAFTELDLGGGLGIKYVEHDTPLPSDRMAAGIRELVEAECERFQLAMPRLLFEPGRAIVGPSMITLYTVGTVKTINLDQGGTRTFVSVDGGMSDNIRTALYGAEYTVALASRTSTHPPMLSRVVGKHCESGDIVVNDCWLPSDLAPGDLLAVAATGAYCRSMASNYNLVCKPAVVGVRDGMAGLILRRETLDDLLALDMGASVNAGAQSVKE